MRICTKSVLIAALFTSSAALQAGVVMYGVNGGHASTAVAPDGDLVIVDQTTGAVTTLGASGFPRLTGLAIEPNGALFATTLGGVPFPPGPGNQSSSDLLQLSLAGIVLSDIGTIKDASQNIVPIADLAVQPGTGTIFAISNEFGGVPSGGLYTINPTTAVATLVGATGQFFGSIAFAPDESLYMVGASFSMGPVNPLLLKLNPSTAATIGNPVALDDFYGAFGIRPTDGLFFLGNGDGGQIFTLNPTTGAVTGLPTNTGSSFVADLAFAAPEPGSFLLAGLSLAGLTLACRRRSTRRG